MNGNVATPPEGGSHAGLPGDRVQRGGIAKWAASTGWVDRDGMALPGTMLVIGYTTVLRRWKDKRPEYITEHPLTDPEVLNAAIPISEWETGLDGKPRKPWALCYAVYLVDLNTAALFTYAHDTFGAMQAYTNLEERIAVMRMLRGEFVFPIVRLEKRTWKSTLYGLQQRPHFEPTGDWRSPGGFQTVAPSPAPQISGPTTATPPTTPATPSSTPSTPTAPPPAAAASAPASPVLNATKPVKPVTVGEMIADQLPDWA
jgi:hypothetical protein